MKHTTGMYPALDIHFFQKLGLLKPGGVWRVTANWFGGEAFDLEIWALDDPDRISIKDCRSGQWLACFELLKTPCRYGGFRHWFMCPACEKRKGKLYRHQGAWKCRTCADLTYYSTQSRGHCDKVFGFLAHDWKEDRRLEREYRRISQQKRKQYTYRGQTIKRLRYRERRCRGLSYELMQWMKRHA